MGFLDGGGFDWNGNGKSDAFDNYMDMKVSGSNSSDSEGEESGANVRSSSSHKKQTPLMKIRNLKGYPWAASRYTMQPKIATVLQF